MNFLKKLFGISKKKNYNERPPKFLGELNDKISHTMPITKANPKEHYIIKHNGEYMVFNSKDEMPEEIREGIQEIETVETISSVYNVIIDGERYIYSNYHDIPEDIKKVIDGKKKF